MNLPFKMVKDSKGFQNIAGIYLSLISLVKVEKSHVLWTDLIVQKEMQMTTQEGFMATKTSCLMCNQSFLEFFNQWKMMRERNLHLDIMRLWSGFLLIFYLVEMKSLIQEILELPLWHRILQEKHWECQHFIDVKQGQNITFNVIPGKVLFRLLLDRQLICLSLAHLSAWTLARVLPSRQAVILLNIPKELRELILSMMNQESQF